MGDETPLAGGARRPGADRPRVGLLLMLGSLIAFAPLSIDMYLPGLPGIAQEFSVPAGVAQYTLAAYFIGMALGQPLYGPVSDRVGRKPPLYVGLCLYTAASLGCALSTEVHWLIAARFAQALGGCACGVVALAMVVDRFDRQDTARVLSRLMLVMGVAPILAPALGSVVVAHWGWRAIFGLLAVAGAAALLGVRLLLAESLAPERRRSLGVAAALRGYGALLRQRTFMGLALVAAFASGGLFAYIAGSSFVFIDLLRLSASQFGVVFGLNALGLIAASQLNHVLLRRWRSPQVLNVTVVAFAVCGALTCAVALVLKGPRASLPGAWVGLLLPMFCFLVAYGVLSPNVSSSAMSAHREGGGSASALLGTLQFGMGAASGALVGWLNDGTAVPMAGVMAGCGLAGLVCWKGLVPAAARR